MDFRSILRHIQGRIGPSGWNVTPGASTAISAGVIDFGAEAGVFTTVNRHHTNDVYQFSYTMGGTGVAIGPPIPEIQVYPGDFPAGSVGTVWRIPPYAPPSRGPNGVLYEMGPPTGFRGPMAMLGVNANAGVLPGFSGAAGLLFMGHPDPPESVIEAVARMAYDRVAERLAGELGSFFNKFQYVTLVYATGLTSPTVSVGASISIGLVDNMTQIRTQANRRGRTTHPSRMPSNAR